MWETLAFTLLIGGQFLAAVYLISRRHQLYPERTTEAVEEKLPRLSTAPMP
jgi:hypothetical protein